MTQERARHLIANRKPFGELRYSFQWSSYVTNEIHEDGITVEEEQQVTKHWNKMPGNASWFDALLEISKGVER